MRFLRLWIYLPLTFGIASLISIFAWDSFIVGGIFGILGVVLTYIALNQNPDELNICGSGFAVSSTGIGMVIYYLIEKYLD